MMSWRQQLRVICTIPLSQGLYTDIRSYYHPHRLRYNLLSTDLLSATPPLPIRLPPQFLIFFLEVNESIFVTKLKDTQIQKLLRKLSWKWGGLFHTTLPCPSALGGVHWRCNCHKRAVHDQNSETECSNPKLVGRVWYSKLWAKALLLAQGMSHDTLQPIAKCVVWVLLLCSSRCCILSFRNLIVLSHWLWPLWMGPACFAWYQFILFADCLFRRGWPRYQ